MPAPITPTAPVSPTVPAPAIANSVIGKVDVRMERDTPLFAGNQEGAPNGYGTLTDAYKASSRLSLDHSNAGLLIVSAGTGADQRFFSYALQQPLWTKHELYEGVTSLATARFDQYPLSDGKLKFTSYDDYNQHSDDPIGKFVPSVPNFAAIVSGTLAITPAGASVVEPAAAPPDSALIAGLTEADRLLDKDLKILKTIPADKATDGAYTPVRKQVYDTNMAAQQQLEQQFQRPGIDPDAVSHMRRADANLEDANWQVVPKVSPDGRFHGIDIPGAIASTTEAKQIVSSYLADLLKQAEQPA